MKRIHVALAVDDLDTTIADYTERLGASPITVVTGKYALWRTTEVNLSVNSGVATTGRLRHLGFEDDEVATKSETTDVNGIRWEAFSPASQDEAIGTVYGPTR